MVRKYRKKPVVIEALQYTGENLSELREFTGDDSVGAVGLGVFIETLEGTMRVRDFDYVIKGVAGEFYPCNREIFMATYEEEED